MRSFLIAAAFALAAGTASADLIARNGANELRLMASPCVNEVILERIKPEFHGLSQKGQATVGGMTYPACWIDNGEGSYIVFFPDGEGVYPVTGFISEPGV